MKTVLDDIIERVRADLPGWKRRMTIQDFESEEGFEKPVRSLFGALRRDVGSDDGPRGEVRSDHGSHRDMLQGDVRSDGMLQQDAMGVAVIAEVKKGSPSKGVFRPDRPFEPVEIAKQYVEGGASAISVLTNEPFFFGSMDHLRAISRFASVPLLRKDFLIDPWQIAEARAFGADAVLLIESVLSPAQRNELMDAAAEMGVEVLLECYHEAEWSGLDWERVRIAGVNNRDLRTFDVDLHRGLRLLETAPEGVVRVSESGLSSAEDLLELHRSGVHAALIGEQFVRQDRPGEALSAILGQFQGLVDAGLKERFDDIK